MSEAMTKAIAICTKISKAIDPLNTSVDQLRQANAELKNAKIENFSDLRIDKGTDISVDGHFIFDEKFIDSVIVNRKIISISSIYARNRNRGCSSSTKGRIKMTTKALKAGQTCVWKTVNKDNPEFALIAEPTGLFTMTIRDEKGKTLYAETRNHKKGDSIRKAKLKLPDVATKILIEVKNCGDNDASFALLSD